jgi:hypothetical protein
MSSLAGSDISEDVVVRYKYWSTFPRSFQTKWPYWACAQLRTFLKNYLYSILCTIYFLEQFNVSTFRWLQLLLAANHCTDIGGSRLLRNVAIFQRDYIALYLRRLSSLYSPPWEPDISLYPSHLHYSISCLVSLLEESWDCMTQHSLLERSGRVILNWRLTYTCNGIMRVTATVALRKGFTEPPSHFICVVK